MPETRVLATYIVNSRMEEIPQKVCHEAKRALLNGLGCAVGGSREPAVDIALRALSPYSGNPTAKVLSRKEQLDPLHAALINGICTHVFEYDDTLPKNYIHPTPPVAAALFAFASANRVNGSDFIHAFLLGFEAESRIGNAVYPAHYDAGWHITSTAGVFGAAAAIGRLLNLSVQEMIWAIGIAATQAAGLREMFGSMAKFFHAGRAAQNGYLSALLAQAGFTAGEHSIEGPRGFAAVQSSSFDLSRITDGLGKEFQILENTYKPYPCGLVVHPTIDGCIRIHNEQQDRPENIRAVRLRVAPLVLDLCNKRELTRGLESKYSIYHSAAVGLVRGRAGIREFSDDVLADAAIRQVRESVVATADPSITEDQSFIEVEYESGRIVRQFVEQSLGNLKMPLSDKQLEDKFRDQASLVLPAAQVEKLIELCWKIDELDDVAELVNASIPS